MSEFGHIRCACGAAPGEGRVFHKEPVATKGKFTLGADAAVAAGPVGRNVQASTDENLKAEIYSYSRSKGFFAGIALDGTVIRIDRKANETMYGDMVSPASIFDGRTQTQNQAIIDFRNQLEEGSSRQAKK